MPADAQVIVYTGRLDDGQKNVLRLTDALVEVLSERPRVFAVCAGEGPHRAEVLARAARAGLRGRLLAPGYVDAVFALLRRADVFVSPSHYEGRPNTVAEALAARAPACLSRIPQHTEFVPADAAIFVDPTRVGEIAAALRACLDDPDAARLRAARARAVVERQSVAAMSAAYESLYERVLRA
ncbi:MAG: glycosyltransferase [Polyangiales bacterium]